MIEVKPGVIMPLLQRLMSDMGYAASILHGFDGQPQLTYVIIADKLNTVSGKVNLFSEYRASIILHDVAFSISFSGQTICESDIRLKLESVIVNVKDD